MIEYLLSGRFYGQNTRTFNGYEELKYFIVR